MHLALSLADQNLSTAASIGIYNISLGLLQHLAHQPAVTRLTALVNPTIPAFADSTGRIDRVEHAAAIRSAAGRLYWDNWGVYRAARHIRPDWLLLPKGFASILRPSPVRLAVYLHDLISVIYARRYPGHTSRLRDAYYQAVYRQTLRHADLVFTNTEFTRREILDWTAQRRLRCPPIHIAGYGFPPPVPPRPKQDVIILLVRHTPHKRSDLAVPYVYRWQKASGYAGRIICVGSLPAGIRMPEDPAWSWAGRVTPDIMLRMMGEARAVVHFTDYEGFGMPPVEAALAGSCPVFSAIPVAREVMGSCGLGFENDRYESFQHAMDQALQTPDATVTGWATALYERHHWEKVARRVVDALAAHAA